MEEGHMPAMVAGTPSVASGHPLKLAARDTPRVPLNRQVVFLRSSVVVSLGLPVVENDPDVGGLISSRIPI
ncbi:hypothetical protein CDL15_Pgr004511 [Punica granatum]|uniref:Uncharacterized protein n=1 Tax=Punica granatum TaxID=22663 RepID=A0A218WYD9_PUNGR|nr:hypothetical protein CDL15_Pgr004511 [Punica granatum]